MNYSGMLVIIGKNEKGDKFRPSDWAEMLSGQMCTFAEDKRLCYSDYLRPVQFNGYNSLVVKKELQQINEYVWNHVLSFAKDNTLVIQDGDEQFPLF
jgi:hypothetical protein